ncbi:hypothetical protein ACU8KH_05125 [Lachancea thermotolerans]
MAIIERCLCVGFKIEKAAQAIKQISNRFTDDFILKATIHTPQLIKTNLGQTAVPVSNFGLEPEGSMEDHNFSIFKLCEDN